METTLAPEVNEALLGRWVPVYRSQLHYQVTWSTRGRRPVLKSRHAQAVHELVGQVCDERDISLVEVAIAQDHVHVLFGLRPAQSVASAVRELKGRSGMALMTRFPELRVWLGGNIVWDERYAVETVSPARLQKVQLRLRTIHGQHDQLAEAG